MDSVKIDIDKIKLPNSFSRQINPDAVATLAASIKELGLHTPITVRSAPETILGSTKTREAYEMVVGRHRLEAVKQLGWTEIDAVIVPDSDDTRACDLWEIAENLHRAELTRKERARLHKIWCEVTGSQVAQVGPPKKPQYKKQGIREAARQLGIKRQELDRSLKIESLSPEAKEASVQLGLDDNQQALLAAAEMKTAEAQVKVLEQRAKAETKVEPKAETKPPADAAKTVLQELRKLSIVDVSGLGDAKVRKLLKLVKQITSLLSESG